MKIQKIVLTLIAVIFLAFCIDSVLLEGYFLVKEGKNSILSWISSRPEKTESELNEHLHAREWLFEFKGLFNRLIDKRYVYGLYKLENGHLVTPSLRTDIDDKLKNLIAFHDWCSGRSIPLLYINLPAKSENKFFAHYGLESFSGENADELLAGLEAHGIDYLDMRDHFPSAGLDSLDIFFKTEHHWKISAGLFSARVISQYINDHYQLGLDTDVIAPDKMHMEFMPQSWVGESGRRTSIAFSGKEDFEYITPLDPGSFHLMIPDREIDETGGFSVMINESVFQKPDLYRDSFYYAYLFGNDPLQVIDNLEERSGRILIIKDSFAQSVNPFLAMTADELTSWDVRYNKEDLREYLTDNPVNIVVVMYTESFIQSRMFQFTGSK